MTSYLSSTEAADLLGVTLPTLYAYVSRGLVRSQDAPSGRRKLYAKEDIDRLLAIKQGRRNPRRAAAEALSWGDPVLDSAITLIRDDRFFYRGHDATELAATHSFEEVAGLIWLDDLEIGPALFEGTAPDPPPAVRKGLARIAELDDVLTFQTLLPGASAADPLAYAVDPDSTAQVGARIIRLLVTAAAAGTAGEAPGGPIARRLQRAWCPRNPEAAGLIDAALVLCADHELNVSAFTVRCVASAGGSLYGALTAGLAAIQGTRHGGVTERVEVFLDEAAAAPTPAEAVRNRLARGEDLPGFGHPLYTVDPRARFLLDRLAAAFYGHPFLAIAEELAEAVRRAGGAEPTIDFGLVVLRRTLRMPRGAALTLFALGRTAGWVGQAIEQYQADRLIRPRARYVGR